MSKQQPSLLGKRIRELRLAANLSQPELGRRANISSSYISQLETGGRRNCTMEVIRSIADAFGYPVETLLKDAGMIPEDLVNEQKKLLIDKVMQAAELLPERVLQSELERLEIQAAYYRQQKILEGNTESSK